MNLIREAGELSPSAGVGTELNLHYLKFQYFHPDFENPKEKYFEVSENCRVKRSVHVDYGGEATRQSVEILINRHNSPKNEYRFEKPLPDFCLYGKVLNSLDELAKDLIAIGFEQVPIQPQEFFRTYNNATPE